MRRPGRWGELGHQLVGELAQRKLTAGGGCTGTRAVARRAGADAGRCGDVGGPPARLRPGAIQSHLPLALREPGRGDVRLRCLTRLSGWRLCARGDRRAESAVARPRAASSQCVATRSSSSCISWETCTSHCTRAIARTMARTTFRYRCAPILRPKNMRASDTRTASWIRTCTRCGTTTCWPRPD